jgi:hypothetical protein
MAETITHQSVPEHQRGGLTHSAVLQAWLSKVEAALVVRPGQSHLRKTRAGLLRGLGRLDEAAQAYAELADGDEEAAILAAVLTGAVRGPAGPGGPIRFVRLAGVLTAEEQHHLWQTVTAPDARYVPSRVGVGDSGRLDPSMRCSVVMQNPDALRPWFLPRIAGLVEREQVLDRLGLAPFPVGERELQVTRHLDGGFYCAHRDTCEKDGPATGRTLTYVYYFHQTPRSFSGGDILLFDHGPDDKGSKKMTFTRLEPLHNSLVFFASDRLHEVTKVICPESGAFDGRWTVNGWFHRADQHQGQAP